MKTYFALGLALCTLVAAPAIARDRYVGTYDGDCGFNGCTLDIDNVKGKKAWKLSLDVHLGTMPSSRDCSVTGTATQARPGVLVGTIGDSPIEIRMVEGHDMIVSRTSGTFCGKSVRLDGTWSILGD